MASQPTSPPPYRAIDEIAGVLARQIANEGLEPLLSRVGYVPLLPFLEHPYEAVQSQFRPVLSAAGISNQDQEKL